MGAVNLAKGLVCNESGFGISKFEVMVTVLSKFQYPMNSVTDDRVGIAYLLYCLLVYTFQKTFDFIHSRHFVCSEEHDHMTKTSSLLNDDDGL